MIRKPIMIAHRGNVYGPNPAMENNPDYLRVALEMGYHVETDVWLIDGFWWLGHDGPQYVLEELDAEKLFLDQRVWCHCKNFEALFGLQANYPNAHYFWHQEDDYTLTSQGIVWAYPGKAVVSDGLLEDEVMTVAVMPERCPNVPEMSEDNLKRCYGICTDEVIHYNYVL